MTPELYTVDLQHERLDIDHRGEQLQLDEQGRPKVKRVKVEAKKKRQEVKDLCLNSVKGWKAAFALLQDDDDYKQMRKNFTQAFFDKWKVGFQHYLNGEWDTALTVFEETRVRSAHQTMVPGHEDGPSRTLSNVIKNSLDRPPRNWKGYRELTEK